MKYRAEIDGLRAISVLSVFLFHLGDKSASGGLVGVDVFFVISGYLITTLIYTESKVDRFSLTAFYVRRIKRIAPALLTLTLVVMATGYLILAPGDYDVLAQSSLFALAGASNFFFLNYTGYFDATAEMMPMLHTWSLGVEEQFYVVWPGLFIVLWKIAEKKRICMLTSIFVLIAVSFVTYLVINNTNPKVAFYMPYTRAWELALGGIIPFLPEITNTGFSRFKKILPWIGLCLYRRRRFSIPLARGFYRKQDYCVSIGRFPDHICNTAKIFSPSNSKVWTTGLYWENLLFDLLVSLADDRVVEALCVHNSPRLRLAIHHLYDSHLLAVVAFYRAALPAGSMELEGGVSGIFRQPADDRFSVRDRHPHAWCHGKSASIDPVHRFARRDVGLGLSKR